MGPPANPAWVGPPEQGMRRILQIAITSGLALGAGAGLVAYLTLRPVVLRVAVATGGEDHGVILAAAQAMLRERAPVRFRLVLVENPAASAARLEANDADFAVVRSDIAMPSSAATAVILHRDSIVLMTPPDLKIEKILDLRGKTVAWLRSDIGARSDTANERLLESILLQYDMPTASVKRLSAAAADVVDLFKDKRADAILAVGAASAGQLPDAVAAAARNGEAELKFIAIPEAEAIAQRAAAFEAIKILRGAFGGAPPRPSHSFDTLSVSTRLVARNDVPNAQVADVTRFFFTKRGLIAERAPLASRIEAPSTDKDTALPVHPGAAAYLDNDEDTFFDRYSDVFYISAMLLSVAGSGLAALASRITSNKRARIEDSIERLLEILKAARSAVTLTALDGLEDEADGILHSALASVPGAADSGRLSAMTLALDQARLAIAERRKALRPASLALAPPAYVEAMKTDGMGLPA